MKFPFVTLIISALSSASFFLFGSPESLIWISEPDKQNTWQNITAHFTHIGFDHFIWNIIAFIGISSIIEQQSRTDLIVGLAISIIGVNIYLANFYPLAAYTGLSGILNGLIVIALFQLSKKPEFRIAVAISFLATLIKILFEIHFDTSIFTSLVWPSVPEAHLAGFISGCLYCLFCIGIDKLKSCSYIGKLNTKSADILN